jgi:hypothetical protein
MAFVSPSIRLPLAVRYALDDGRTMKRVVEVSIHDESLAVTYDREAFLRASAEVAPTVFLADKPLYARSGATVDVLVEAIVSWDLFEDDGRPCRTDRDTLSNLPLHLLYRITQAIEADAFESERRT